VLALGLAYFLVHELLLYPRVDCAHLEHPLHHFRGLGQVFLMRQVEQGAIPKLLPPQEELGGNVAKGSLILVN